MTKKPKTYFAEIRDEREGGQREDLSSADKERFKTLERENRELRQANEILRKASAYFPLAEFDRPLKR